MTSICPYEVISCNGGIEYLSEGDTCRLRDFDITSTAAGVSVSSVGGLLLTVDLVCTPVTNSLLLLVGSLSV